MSERKSTIQDVLRDLLLEDFGLAQSGSDDGELRTLGRYLLIEEIGRGGCGRVYRALHEELLKPFAVKVIPVDEHTPDLQRERFLREAKIAAQLDHPGVIDVHDVGREGDVLYIAMDLIDSETLDTWSRAEGRDLNEILRVLESVARAVDFAHGRGIVHRDLKPQNVIVRPSGEPVIVDFGLARLAVDRRLTQEGSVLGTPSTMAPEQLKGEVDRIGPRSDIFALGVLLYECTTGRLPHAGESAVELFEQIRRGSALPPSRVRPGLPGALDMICARCLEPEPEHRYASAAELADAIAGVREGHAPPKPGLRHVLRRRLRTIGPVRLSIIAMLLLALMGGWIGYSLVHSPTTETATLEQAHRLQSALGVLGPRLEPLIRRAEEVRYRSPETARAELIPEVARIVEASGDNTGVGEAYLLWAQALLGAPDVERRFAEARQAYPGNPVIPLMAARYALRRYAERLEWPGGSGVLMHPVEKPFADLAPEDDEARALLEAAALELRRARESLVWKRLPALSWLADLCRGYELFARRQWGEATSVLEPLAERSDLTMEARLLLSLAYCHLGDEDGAFRTATAMVEARPKLRPAVRALAEFHQLRALNRLVRQEEALPDIDRAQELFESISGDVEADPILGHVLAMRATALRRRGEDAAEHFERAIAVLEGALANDPSNFELAVNQATMLSQLAKLSKDREALTARARARLEAARETGGDHPFILGGLLQVSILELQSDLSKSLTLDRARHEELGEDIDRLEAGGADRAVVALYRSQRAYLLGEEARLNGRPMAEAYRETARLADVALEIAPDLLEALALKIVPAMYCVLEDRGPRETALELIDDILDLAEVAPHMAVPPDRLATWLDQLMRRRRDATDAELAERSFTLWTRAAADGSLTMRRKRAEALLRWCVLGDDVPIETVLEVAESSGSENDEAARRMAACLYLEAAELATSGAPRRRALDAALRLIPREEAGREVPWLLIEGRAAVMTGDGGAASLHHAREALRAGASGAGDWNTLLNDCWLILSVEGREPRRHRTRLELAQAIFSVDPDNGALLNTVGVGLYRLGRHEDAVRALEQSLGMNRASFGHEHPADLAFLALSHLANGDAGKTASLRLRLSETVGSRAYRHDSEALRFLDEVERAWASRSDPQKDQR
ncbi:MAG: protein kinase [Planctomycetota bacterium]